jgi:hypothetical protein
VCAGGGGGRGAAGAATAAYGLRGYTEQARGAPEEQGRTHTRTRSGFHFLSAPHIQQAIKN